MAFGPINLHEWIGLCCRFIRFSNPKITEYDSGDSSIYNTNSSSFFFDSKVFLEEKIR
jgi:hypothetical protein